MDSQSVICPISGIKHQVLNIRSGASIQSLKDWSKDILDRANSGKRINLSVDCEGVMLGEVERSLLTIQLAEVYDSSFSPIYGGNLVPLAPKPGFIIFYPGDSQAVVEMLSGIFSHPNVCLIIFDFTNELCVFFEHGIRIRLENLFDPQLANVTKHVESHIKNVKIRGLKWYVEQLSRGDDPLFQSASLMLSSKSDQSWDAIFYLVVERGDDLSMFINQKFLEYAACDLIWGGLACTYSFLSGACSLTVKNTKAKCADFMKLSSNGAKPLVPSLLRHLSFFSNYSLFDYINESFDAVDVSDLKRLLKYWVYTFLMISAKRIANIEPPAASFSQVQQNYENVKAILNSKVDKIRSILNPCSSKRVKKSKF